MKQILLTAATLMAVFCLGVSSAQAQDCVGCQGKVRRVAGALKAARGGSGPIFDGDGRVQPQSSWIPPKVW